MNNRKLKIALQKSGRLSEDSINLLKKCGIKFNNGSGKLRAEAENFPLEIYFLRDDDIPQYTEDAVADAGIVGENVLAEDEKNVEIIEKLGCGKCRLSIAVPKSFEYKNLEDLSNKKIATTYPHILNNFFPVQNFIIQTLAGKGIVFSKICIDRTFAQENKPTRKPNTEMLTDYFSDDYDLQNSFVIGDRETDVQLAKNLGSKAIFIKNPNFDLAEIENVFVAENWKQIYEFLKLPPRKVSHRRITKETQISVELNSDGSGKAEIRTGISFFDHMLEQVARHGNIDLKLEAKGDLQVDEHHTIEDTAITLGEAFSLALTDKRGIERYGFCLPMDDCLAQVAVDFGGRNWCVWEAEFRRETIGKMPTEMFFHFFKSFSDKANCNLNIQATGTNEHHKIEAIFKAFAKAVKMAVGRDILSDILPSTKESL